MSHKIEDAERADVMSVSDKPHDWYSPHKFHPDAAVPVPYDSPRGDILLKEVEYSTVQCPECDDTDARKNHKGTPQCPECGMLVVAPNKSDYQIMNDAKGAHRVDSDGNLIQ